jgi:hypothetical protein
MVDVAMWVMGVSEVKQISALLGEPDDRLNMIMNAVIQFSSPGGQLVTHSLTYNSEHLCWEVRFIGREETLVYKNGCLLDENGEHLIPTSSWVDLTNQNAEILDSFARGVSSEYDLASIVAPMRVLHVAQETALKMHEGARERIPS